MKTFNDLPILDQTKKALETLGFTEPTPIQALAIPKMILGLDIIAQAQTGTGKTFAFSIPIIEKINPHNKSIQAVILTPTRELALQVYKEILKLIKFYPDVKAVAIVGGESYTRQFDHLNKRPHIVVATPGRLIDHIDRKTIDLSQLSVLTFDEADEMLKMGFQEDIERILKETPNTRQTVLFSATIPPFIKEIAKNYQKNSEVVSEPIKSLTVEKITQHYFMVKEGDKMALLTRILDYEDPKSAIIFVNTKKDVDTVTEFLQKNQYNADALHGDLKQSQRNYVMNGFRNGMTSFLVATDVAARGLDVSNIEIIVNYDIPFEMEIYVHRIGRTARAGNKGMSYTFVNPKQRKQIMEIEAFTGAQIHLKPIPTKEDIEAKKQYRFIGNLRKSIQVNDASYDDIIDQLLGEGFLKRDIISALISQTKPKNNHYLDIEIVESKQTKRGSKTIFDWVVVNLGRQDKINPEALLRFLKSEFQIGFSSVGDIKHNQNETKFQLKFGEYKKLTKPRKVLYKDKKVSFKLITKR